MNRRFPKRKLTYGDGEVILWHMLEYLNRNADKFRSPEAVATIHELIREVQKSQ